MTIAGSIFISKSLILFFFFVFSYRRLSPKYYCECRAKPPSEMLKIFNPRYNKHLRREKFFSSADVTPDLIDRIGR